MPVPFLIPPEFNNKWAPAINRYIFCIMLNKDTDDDSLWNSITEEMLNAMGEVGIFLSKKYMVNDNVTVIYNTHTLQDIALKFNKIDTGIWFGFDEMGFYVNNRLSFQNRLKSTNDEFWNDFFKLFELGKVVYSQGISKQGEVGKSLNKTFALNKSSCLKIFMDFAINSFHGNAELIDEIEVRFKKTKNEESYEELFTKIGMCIDVFYSLNYRLYHIDHLSENRKRPGKVSPAGPLP
jgi:hypothetical protein